MSAPSASYAALIAKPHRVESRAILQRLTSDGVQVLNDNLPLAGWSVQVDAKQAVRRKLSATLGDPDAFLPISEASQLSPFGNEIVIQERLSGIGVVSEWQSLGVFGIEAPESDEEGPVNVSLSGSDRAQKVSGARLVAPRTIAAGTNVAVAIQELITSRVPGLTYNFVPTTTTTPLLVLEEQDDPWQRAQEIASAAGLELYFDQSGICVLRVPPDPTNPTTPLAFEFGDGAAKILTKVRVELDSELSYSHAVFIGEGPDETPPVRADAFDDDPNSPTYWLGPFGDKPVFLKTPIVSPDPTTAVIQGQAAARGLLAKKRGAFRTVSIESLPISSLEGSDLIRVTSERSGVDQVLTLDSFTLSSDKGRAMSAATRAVRSL